MESIKQKVPQIKICGITQDEEIQWLNEADVSYAGFVLYEKAAVTFQSVKHKNCLKIK